MTWLIYDTVALNELLDSHEQVQLDSEAAQNACLGSFTQRGSAIVRPNESFQGVDLLGSREIFTSGGHEGKTPQIAKMLSSGHYQSLVNIVNVGKREIEGVQTKDGKVYFTIVTDPHDKKNTQKIYYVPDNIF